MRGNKYEGAAAPVYLAEKNRRSAEKNSKSTMRLVALALIVSLIAMLFSIVDYFGDRTWRKDQLETLQKIQANTKAD